MFYCLSALYLQSYHWTQEENKTPNWRRFVQYVRNYSVVYKNVQTSVNCNTSVVLLFIVSNAQQHSRYLDQKLVTQIKMSIRPFLWETIYYTYNINNYLLTLIKICTIQTIIFIYLIRKIFFFVFLYLYQKWQHNNASGYSVAKRL